MSTHLRLVFPLAALAHTPGPFTLLQSNRSTYKFIDRNAQYAAILFELHHMNIHLMNMTGFFF